MMLIRRTLSLLTHTRSLLTHTRSLLTHRLLIRRTLFLARSLFLQVLQGTSVRALLRQADFGCSAFMRMR